MSFHYSIATTQKHDEPREAAKEVATKAISGTGQENADILLVLASTHFDQKEMMAGISEAAGETPVVGCSTAGAITNEGPLEETLAVLALASDTMTFHPIKIEEISKDMRAAGEQFGNSVIEQSEGAQKIAFIFSDALAGNGTELVRGVLGTLGANFPLIGGAAGDDMNFKKTFQYFGKDALNDAAVGFAIKGNVSYAVGADHGWKPLGAAKTITKAEGTTLHELDGKPAFSIYEEYFNERASDFKKTLSLAAVQYPLGMKTNVSDKYMIRVPLSIQDDGSIVCGAELIEGATINLMIGSKESALNAAEDTINEIVEYTRGVEPRVVFVSDCVARKILYGRENGKEITSIKDKIGETSSLFGFYSYGQVAPFAENEKIDVKTCDPGFYEQSISLAAFGEATQ